MRCFTLLLTVLPIAAGCEAPPGPAPASVGSSIIVTRFAVGHDRFGDGCVFDEGEREAVLKGNLLRNLDVIVARRDSVTTLYLLVQEMMLRTPVFGRLGQMQLISPKLAAIRIGNYFRRDLRPQASNRPEDARVLYVTSERHALDQTVPALGAGTLDMSLTDEGTLVGAQDWAPAPLSRAADRDNLRAFGDCVRSVDPAISLPNMAPTDRP